MTRPKRSARRRGRFAARRRSGASAAVAGVVGLLVIAGLYRAVLSPDAVRPIGGPFLLSDSEGRPQSDRSLRGRFLLMFFGYTNCDDICPTTLSVMSTALEHIDPDATRIQPIFVTVDPARDDPRTLRDYTARFSPTLMGLTGTPSQLHDMQRAFHVVVRPHEDGHDRAVAHTAMLYLLGPDGRFRAAIPADIGGAALETELRRALAGA